MAKQLPLLMMLASTGFGFAQTMNVPSALLLKANRSPLEFAMMLADARVSSGLELKESDFAPPMGITFDFDRTQTVDDVTLLSSFNSQHTDYRAEQMTGVLVIRPLMDKASALEEFSPINTRLIVKGAMRALRKIFPPPAASGQVIEITTGFTSEGENVSITLDNNSGADTIIDSLNQLVKQYPATWYVATRRQGDQSIITKAGLVQRNGTITAFDVSPPR